MISTIAESGSEVRVRRHSDIPECEVLVAYRGKVMSLRCRDLQPSGKMGADRMQDL
jgi:hypothetical protein